MELYLTPTHIIILIHLKELFIQTDKVCMYEEIMTNDDILSLIY